MAPRSFEPKFMKMSVLTAALQELTPRQIRDEDPDRAIEDWLEFSRELDCPNIRISAALHPTETDVPPEAMLDPVANTLDLRKPFDKTRANRVLAAMKSTGVGVTDIAFFDNLLHDDNDIRKKKHDFVLRMMDAAAGLGLKAVCGFVGRNQKLSMDQNLVFFEEVFVPLLKEAKARGLEYRVEQCPMPGWTVGDNFHNNIGYAPGMWIALHRICERHGVGDQLRVHYDPSHAILMGQDTRSIFQYLKDSGYDFIVGGFHVKGQVIDPKGVSAWGYGGQTVERGDWKNGKPSPNPADQANAWKKQTVLCEHELPGTAKHDPLGYLQNRTVDWLDHQLAARELLKLDVANTALVIEHEYPRARIQDKERLKPILKGSIAFARKIDEAAACMYALHHEVLPAQDIPVQGRGRIPYLTYGEKTMAKRKLNVAMIGYDFMGRAHSNAWRQVGRFFEDLPVEPVMKVVVGRTEAKVKEAQARLGFEEAATSWQEVLARKDIDIIDICTPGDSHAAIAIAAAEAGKAILCEKPLANTVPEAERMAGAAKKAGVVNMICHNYRRVPAVALAKKIIDEGQIGDIHHYRGLYLQDWIVDPNFPRVWRLEKARAGSGSLGDILSHTMDLSRHLVGEPVEVSGLLKTFITERPLPDGSGKRGKVDVDDAAQALVKFGNGAVGYYEGSRFAPGRKNYNRFEINGSKGSIVWDLERLNELELYIESGPLSGFRNISVTDGKHPYMAAWWPPGHIVGYEHSFTHTVHDFLQAVAEGKSPRPDFEDGLKNQRVLEAIEKSANTGQWVKIA